MEPIWGQLPACFVWRVSAKCSAPERQLLMLRSSPSPSCLGTSAILICYRIYTSAGANRLILQIYGIVFVSQLAVTRPLRVQGLDASILAMNRYCTLFQ